SVSCARWKAAAWCSPPTAAPRASASTRSRRSRSTTSIRARASFLSAPRAAISLASSARTGTSPSRARWTSCRTRRARSRSPRRHVGPEVPLHFTAFHPDWKMTDIPATPAATLTRAREIGQLAGLNYVYTGNVHDSDGGSTYCPSCEKPVIVRDWYRIDGYHVTADGRCEYCSAPIAGRFGKFERPFGPRRIPVRLAA